MDLESEGKATSAEDLECLHRAKTGALLGGVRPRRGDPRRARRPTISTALSRYASAIGLAFQVVDDVLDATEESASLGKTAGKDAAAHKATYVSVHGLERARAMAADLRQQALDAVAPLGRARCPPRRDRAPHRRPALVSDRPPGAGRR